MVAFKNCSIIIPVIRESETFEHVVKRLIETCQYEDIAEFVIAIHPNLTGEESLKSIEKMRGICEAAGFQYSVVTQKLPGMGGAIRDAMDTVTGSHATMVCADYCYDPIIIKELIEVAKIDGASEFKSFFRIALPLAKPIIAVITLYYAFAKWNSYYARRSFFI